MSLPCLPFPLSAQPGPAGRPRHAPRPLLRAAGPAAALVLALLAACGGGGQDTAASAGTVPSATAAVLTEGTLSGFGSIYVNGVRFDESTATVLDDAGSSKTASALKLGMQVSVDSGTLDTSTATAKASQVRYGSLVLGPVSVVDATAGTLTVLGQRVSVSSSTVFGDTLAAGLSAVAAGAVVEVHGLPDSATGALLATRIEAPSTPPSSYKLRGTVASLNTTAKTFSIGAAAISYATVANVPSSLADGAQQRVVLATSPVDGVWQASSLGGTRRAVADTTAVHVRGAISAFSSAASFTVNGLAVDAATASFPDGSTGLALGTQVEVKGTVSNGVLVATEVSIETRHSHDDSRKLQLRGAITALDTVAKTFVVRGVTVDYSSSTLAWDNGSEASLAVGVSVRVVGTVGSTRTQVLASKVRIGG